MCTDIPEQLKIIILTLLPKVNAESDNAPFARGRLLYRQESSIPLLVPTWSFADPFQIPIR